MNYELLRPFDMEAAKRGEPIVFIECGEMKPRKLIAGPDKDGSIVIRDEHGRFGISTAKPYNMAPLAWVEGKPVYKGDVLYWNRPSFHKFVATRADKLYVYGQCDSYADSGDAGMRAETLTWNPPKAKREGWVNVYGVGDAFIYSTEREANDRASDDRITCVRIEWEEPA